MRLENRVAIVTGGGSGIGRGISLEFASEGARVAVVDLNADNAKSVATEIEAAGGTALPVPCDITDEQAVAAMAETVAGEFGGIDILVNNAGRRIIKPFADHTLEDWRAMIDTNLTSQFLCGRAVLPYLRRSDAGRVINIASVAAHIGRPDRVAYCAAKAGILGLTRGFAADMAGTGIRVNSISPGSIHTPMNATYATDENVDWGGETLAGRWGTPADIAKAAVFLASDDSDFMTGSDVKVEGGWLAARARDGE